MSKKPVPEHLCNKDEPDYYYHQLMKLATTPEEKERLTARRCRYESELEEKRKKIAQMNILIEKILLETSHRLKLSTFNHDDIIFIGNNTDWMGSGKARPDLFIASIEGIAWDLKFNFDCESHPNNIKRDRKKVRREVAALRKAFTNLSDTTLRIISLSKPSHYHLLDVEGISLFLDSLNFEYEFPRSSELRKRWILDTAEVFKNFGLPITPKPDGDFAMVLEIIQDSVGFDFGEYGTINAINNILPSVFNS